MSEAPQRHNVRARRTVVAATAVLVVAVAVAAFAIADGGERDEPTAAARGTTPAGGTLEGHATTTRAHLATTTVAPVSTSTTATTVPGPPSDQRTLHLLHTISGHISPKSVVASGRGVVTAQNMMYTHTISVYGADGTLRTTIPDTVDLAALGDPTHTGTFRGAPVEAAFTPDGRYEYVSNYSMYGPGFGPEGSDSCGPVNSYDDSYVYRLDTRTWKIDQAIKVGAVPKYVAVTPNGRTLLVTDWCSYALSIVDIHTAKEVARLHLGAYPRGIVVAPDSTTAYVAIMGTTQIAIVDLRTRAIVTTIYSGGSGPRHLVLSPDGRWLYATLNGSGIISKIDTTTRRVVATKHTGSAPRSMAISADGLSLYVVNYESDSMSKVRASDLAVLQTIATNHHPIGITYDASTSRVWVACYVGTILVFDDQ